MRVQDAARQLLLLCFLQLLSILEREDLMRNTSLIGSNHLMVAPRKLPSLLNATIWFDLHLRVTFFDEAPLEWNQLTWIASWMPKEKEKWNIQSIRHWGIRAPVKSNRNQRLRNERVLRPHVILQRTRVLAYEAMFSSRAPDKQQQLFRLWRGRAEAKLPNESCWLAINGS